MKRVLIVAVALVLLAWVIGVESIHADYARHCVQTNTCGER